LNHPASIGAQAACRQAPSSALEGLDVRSVKGSKAARRSHQGCAVLLDALEDALTIFEANSFAEKREVRPKGVYHDGCAVPDEPAYPTLHVKQDRREHFSTVDGRFAWRLGSQ
jgi:hypothetical protein